MTFGCISGAKGGGGIYTDQVDEYIWNILHHYCAKMSLCLDKPV